MNKDKKEIINQWNNNPCGQVGDITYDLKYFTNVESNRYEQYGPWMKEFYQYESVKHKDLKILEVGYGQGTDLVQYAKSGAECFGIDYTPKHVELAKLNFELRKMSANLVHGDASKLPYEDNSFDKIVSFGVLHHTPDMDLCIDEIYRVLKPGGELVLSLYHKNSIFQYKRMIVDGIFKLKLFTLGYKGLMATVEIGADGKKIKPLVNVYSKKTLAPFLKKFSKVKYDIRHLDRKTLGFLNILFSENKMEKMRKRFGWYIIATVVK